MVLALLSITMFFTMIFATIHALRNEARDERMNLQRSPYAN